MKAYWLATMAHVYAQSAAFFFAMMMTLIYLLVRHEVKKELKDAK